MRVRSGVGRRLMAYGLAASLLGTPLCLGQTLKSAGSLTGRIFAADGVTPRTGVVVKVANLATSQIFTSVKTDGAGRYALPTLPAGQYQVAVESREGLYVNQDRVPVVQGRKTLFSLALNPVKAQDEPPQNPPPENPPSPEPPPQEPPPPPEQPPTEPPPPEAKPEEKPKEEKPKEQSPAEQEAAKKKKKGAGFWRSGWGVATGLGGGAVVLGLLADSIAGESEDVPSPSTP